MRRPWTRGEITLTHPHILLAPGVLAPRPRSSRALWALISTPFAAALLGCAGPVLALEKARYQSA